MHSSEFLGIAVNPHTSPKGKGPFRAVMAFTIIVLIVAFVIFRGPLSGLVRAYVISVQGDPEEAKKEAAYRALELDVNNLLEIVDSQFDVIVYEADQFAARFENLTDIPLSLAHTNSTKQIDHAIIKSEAFADTLAQILNARLIPESIDQQKRSIRLVRNHLQNGTLTDIHRTLLQQNLEWIRSQQDALETQKTRLDQVADWLEK